MTSSSNNDYTKVLQMLEQLEFKDYSTRKYITLFIQKLIETKTKSSNNFAEIWQYLFKVIDSLSSEQDLIPEIVSSKNQFSLSQYSLCICCKNVNSSENSSLQDEEHDYVNKADFSAPTPPPMPPPIPSVPQPPPMSTLNNQIKASAGSSRTPNCKMRKLQWDKLNANWLEDGPSIWAFKNMDFFKENTFAEMEEFFSAAGSRLKVEPVKEKKKLEEICLLDGKRSLNVNIYLKKLKLSTSEIRTCLSTGQGQLIAADKLLGLLNVLPDQEELDLLRGFSGDLSKLGEAERFYLELSSLNGYKSCVQCLLIREEFHQMSSTIKSTVDTFILAANDILRSSMLKDIFQIVLISGNFLNSGGFTGEASAFKLSSLLKLRDTKSNREGFTLLHYIAMILERNRPQVSESITELNRVLEASKYSMNSLIDDVELLYKKMQLLEKNISSLEENLAKNIQTFIKSANETMSLLGKDMKKLEAMRIKVCKYFADDETTFKLDDCFKTINIFIEKLLIVFKENKLFMRKEQMKKSNIADSTQIDSRRFSLCPNLNEMSKLTLETDEVSSTVTRYDNSAISKRQRHISTEDDCNNNDLLKYLNDGQHYFDRSMSVRNRRKTKTPQNTQRERSPASLVNQPFGIRPLSANCESFNSKLKSDIKESVFSGDSSKFKSNIDTMTSGTLTEKALYNHSAGRWKSNKAQVEDNYNQIQDISISSTVVDTNKIKDKYFSIENNSNNSIKKPISKTAIDISCVKYRNNFKANITNNITDEGFVSGRNSIDSQLIHNAKNLKLESELLPHKNTITESIPFARSIDSLVLKPEMVVIDDHLGDIDNLVNHQSNDYPNVTNLRNDLTELNLNSNNNNSNENSNEIVVNDFKPNEIVKYKISTKKDVNRRTIMENVSARLSRPKKYSENKALTCHANEISGIQNSKNQNSKTKEAVFIRGSPLRSTMPNIIGKQSKKNEDATKNTHKKEINQPLSINNHQLSTKSSVFVTASPQKSNLCNGKDNVKQSLFKSIMKTDKSDKSNSIISRPSKPGLK